MNNDVVLPTQTIGRPEIQPGEGLTVIDFVAKQPPGSIYDIVATPDETPFTIPVAEPTVATEEPLELHAPPLVALANSIEAPTQTDDGPVNAEGDAFTEILFITVQEPIVYEIVTAPAEIPPTTPVVAPTVPVAEEPLLHVPPATEFVSVMVCPVQTDDGPAIAAGVVSTVTIAVA